MGKLKDIIAELNNNISDIANQEKAVKLRRALMIIGGILAIVGIVGVIYYFAAFGNAGFEQVDNFHSDPTSTFNPIPIMIKFVVSGIIAGIGTTIFKLGLSITIAGVTTKFAGDVLTDKCPDCGTAIKGDDVFCTSCGKQLRKVCAKCNHINEADEKFCAKCGSQL